MKNFNSFFNQLTAMPKRLAMVLTVLFTLGVGQMWGETWTWTASASGDLGSKNGTVTLNSKSWNVSRSSWIQAGTMNNGCIQVGSKNNPTSLTLETDDFAGYTITEIDVVCSSYNGNHNITMSVGSNTFCSTTSTPSGDGSKAAKVSGTGSAAGTITISFTQKSSAWRAMYIKSITVTYEVAATCDKAVKVEKGTPSGGSFSISKTGTYETCAGALVITLSKITPPAGYQFGEITQSGINTGVAIDQANKTVTYAQYSSGNSTINVTFVELPKYTVTWSVDGTTTTEEVYSGDKATKAPTIDENNLPCDGADKFVGWTTDEYQGDSEPGTLYPTAADIPAITGDKIFYAVFADYANQ